MLKTIKNRRSVRSYSGQEVPGELIDEILDAARWAPSGMNNQPWRFAVIQDKKIKEKLETLTKYGSIIRSARVVIAVFLDIPASYDRTKDLQAIGACIENMLLAICDLGLGGVWLGEILKSGDEVKKIVQAPEEYEFMAAVALGFPDDKQRRAPMRKSLSDLVFFRK